MSNGQIYLKKKSDPRPIIPISDLYPWTPILAERDDMEVYVPGVASIVPPTLQPPKLEDIVVIGNTGRHLGWPESQGGQPPVLPPGPTTLSEDDPMKDARGVPAQPPTTTPINLSGNEGEDTIDPNRVTLIVQAIKGLGPKDYTQKTSQREAMPRAASIEKVLGDKLRAGERDAAWEEFKAQSKVGG